MPILKGAIRSILGLLFFTPLLLGQTDQFLDRPPVTGDIIQYRDFRGREVFGLIVELNGLTTDVEIFDEDGDLDTDTLGPFVKWEYANQFNRAGLVEIKNRMWRSANGKFQAIAKLSAIRSGKVRLEKEDGKKISVDVALLSDKDQKYVEQVRSQFEDDDSDEADLTDYPEAVRKLIARRDELLAREATGRELAKSEVKAKTIKLKSGPFTIELGAIRKPLGGRSTEFSVELPVQFEHPRIQDLVFAEQAEKLAFVFVDPFKRDSILAVVDLNEPDSIVTSDEIAKETELIAISPTGWTLLLFRKGEGRGIDDGFVEIWKNQSGVLHRIASAPVNSVFSPTAVLFNDTEGAIMTSRGQIGIFRIDHGLIPEYAVSISKSLGPTNSMSMSGNGKVLLIHDKEKKSLFGIDIASKSCIGGITLGESIAIKDVVRSRQWIASILLGTVAVAADGNSVISSDDGKVSVFDFKTGKLTKQYSPSGKGPAPVFVDYVWLGDGLLLLGHDNIYDLKLGVQVARIEKLTFPDKTLMVGSTRIYCDTNRTSRGAGVFGSGKASNQQLTVGITRLPLDKIVSHARSLDESDIVALESGDAVKLTMDLGEHQNAEERIREKVRTDLEEGGVKLAPASDFTMHLSYQVGKPVEQTYNIVGLDKRQRTVTMTPKSCSAVLHYQGEKIWSSSHSVGSGRPRDEVHLDQMLAEQNRFSFDKLLEIKYPGGLNGLPPSKQAVFQWE